MRVIFPLLLLCVSCSDPTQGQVAEPSARDQVAEHPGKWPEVSGFTGCMRLVPHDEIPPEPDGPGAFGPLHGTLTLDCLAYVDMADVGGRRIATVVDERGHTHEITLGTSIGENHGRIVAIEPGRIQVQQHLRDGKGGWLEHDTFLMRHQRAPVGAMPTPGN